ncbi:hypothetical protein E4U55_004108 [Claviceps digitariae]|nr:hypothetical protein E4U55_004108 [Claviceps digitariae]
MTDVNGSVIDKAHAMEGEQAKTADTPVDKPMDKPAPSVDEKESNGTNGTTGGKIGHRLGAPKPVEVNSVPQTPLNGWSTPAGGTPRPELKIAEEPPPPAAEPNTEPVIEPIVEPIVKTGDEVSKLSPTTSTPHEHGSQQLPLTESHQEPEASQPVNESVLLKASEFSRPKEPATTKVKTPESAAKEPAVNGTGGIEKPPAEPEAPVVSRKRKLDKSTVSATVKPPVGDRSAPQNALHIDKKHKVGAKPAQPILDDAATAPADSAPSGPKVPKRKKEKKLPTVGRTDRKTRSQGPVDLQFIP